MKSKNTDWFFKRKTGISKEPFRFYQQILFLCLVISGTAQLANTFAAGLPAEYLASQRWRDFFSSRSPASNPAFINEENYVSAKCAISSTLSDFYMHEAGIVFPIGLYQATAVTWLMQGVKTYDKTDTYGISTGKKIKDQNNEFLLTYANNFSGKLTAGANIDFLQHSFDTLNDLRLGIDIGLSYRLFNNPVIGDHQVGLSLQNALNIDFNDSNDKRPRILRIALNSYYFEHRLESGFEYALKDLGVSAEEFLKSEKQMEWDLHVKVGFWLLRMVNLYGLAGFSPVGFETCGFVAGLNTPIVNNGRDLTFMYQYLYILNGDASTSTFYIRSDFGKHREEINARKLAQMVNIAPNELYLKATQLYAQGKYWDAFFLFSQVYTEYPDFFKNDWVSYFLGSCQENLSMNTTATNTYYRNKIKFSKSNTVPFSDLGLMRIYYREGKYDAVEKQFDALNKLGVPDSIKYHSYYLMGQVQMKRDFNSRAKQLFELIPQNHPDYVFANHSKAIIDARMNNFTDALVDLDNCTQAKVNTKTQKEIVNRSLVFLGYLFYEALSDQEGSTANAVAAMRMVPKNSVYYQDALLGLGWTAFKAGQWTDCLTAGQELIKEASSPVLKAEGALLMGYTFIMQKNYTSAIDILAAASEGLNTSVVATQDELNARKADNTMVETKYDDLAKKANNLGSTRQSSVVLKQIDSLAAFQNEYLNQLDEYLKYTVSFQRDGFFARSKNTLQGDIDYALANAKKHSLQRQSQRVNEKVQIKQDEIEKQLELLKNELEKK